MKILYTDILPLGIEKEQETILECFYKQISKADRVEIAVGYISKASLEELNNLVEKYSISKICLNIGMYYIEGMPEGTYHFAIDYNRKWK